MVVLQHTTKKITTNDSWALISNSADEAKDKGFVTSQKTSKTKNTINMRKLSKYLILFLYVSHFPKDYYNPLYKKKN